MVQEKGQSDSTPKEASQTKPKEGGSESKEWGYDLYPERRGEVYKPKWTKVIFGIEGRETTDKFKCEKNVLWCIQESPLVKLMMGALKSSNCPLDIRRHISCEVCDASVTGGYVFINTLLYRANHIFK